MCDYRHESHKTVKNLPVPPEQIHRHLPPSAYHSLTRAIRNGQAAPGHDLGDGRLLPRNELARGHYMSPQNFERSLSRMNANPWQCQWCGTRLPQHIVRQHRVPHNHREHIQHHFHPGCWEARLLAVAIIFGHIAPESLFATERHRPSETHRHTGQASMVEIIRETFRVF